MHPPSVISAPLGLLSGEFLGTGVSCPVLLGQVAAAGDGSPLQMLLNVLPMVVVAAAAWMLLYKPERDRMQRQTAMIAALKKNDRVVTSGGMYGTVANVDREADRVTLKVDDAGSVKIAVTVASIARVLDTEADTSATVN
jgi:preprotein translocase subunit YajC